MCAYSGWLLFLIPTRIGTFTFKPFGFGIIVWSDTMLGLRSLSATVSSSMPMLQPFTSPLSFSLSRQLAPLSPSSYFDSRLNCLCVLLKAEETA
jgi:hypothetical protein